MRANLAVFPWAPTAFFFIAFRESRIENQESKSQRVQKSQRTIKLKSQGIASQESQNSAVWGIKEKSAENLTTTITKASENPNVLKVFLSFFQFRAKRGKHFIQFRAKRGTNF